MKLVKGDDVIDLTGRREFEVVRLGEFDDSRETLSDTLRGGGKTRFLDGVRARRQRPERRGRREQQST